MASHLGRRENVIMLADSLIQKMYKDYQRPMSLNAVATKYGRERNSLRDVFKRRGLKLRSVPGPQHLPNGQFLAAVPLTEAEIEAEIRKLRNIYIPEALKLEWRSWSWDRRSAFVARVRAWLKRPTDRPSTPFSSNVKPFDYCSPEAHEIIKRDNPDIVSRGRKLKLVSQGVIWRGKLYFWNHQKGCGCYVSTLNGPYVRGQGRPLLHHLIWEDANGRPVPPQHTVICVDGNRNNLDPKNLALRSQAECYAQNRAAYLMKQARAKTAKALEQFNHES